MTPAIQVLEAAGVPFVLHEFDRGETVRTSGRDFGREAADALGLDHDRVFKTIVVTVDDEETVAIVPVSCQVGLKSVGQALGGKRVDVCDPARAQRITGYVVGGISPLGQKKRLRTVIDETCELYDTIYVSGGRRGLDVEVRPADLVALTGAVVADIAVGA